MVKSGTQTSMAADRFFEAEVALVGAARLNGALGSCTCGVCGADRIAGAVGSLPFPLPLPLGRSSCGSWQAAASQTYILQLALPPAPLVAAALPLPKAPSSGVAAIPPTQPPPPAHPNLRQAGHAV